MFSVRALEREMDKNSEEVNCLDYKEYPLVDDIEFVQMENIFYLCMQQNPFQALHM